MTDVINNGADGAVQGASAAARRQSMAYRGGEQRPLGGYVALLATYAGAVGAAGLMARRRGLPDRLPWTDVVLMSMATHKVSRILTRDPVTSPLRAPLTRFDSPAGEGEVNEEVRVGGAWHAVGELVTCPFCLGQWVATAIMFGFILAPRATRLATTVFAAVTTSDFLQLAYARACHTADS